MVSCYVWLLSVVVLTLIVILCACASEGLQVSPEKMMLSHRLVKREPDYDTFASSGLDGTVYYDAHQLWTKGKYTAKNLAQVM